MKQVGTNLSCKKTIPWDRSLRAEGTTRNRGKIDSKENGLGLREF